MLVRELLERVKFSIRGRRQARVLLFSLVVILLFSAWGCGRGNPGEKTTASRLLMDTHVDLTLYGVDKKTSQQITKEVFAEMMRLENILSRTEAGSDLNSVNRAAGSDWVEVGPELYLVLGKALEFAELAEGAFDPTVAPLLELWGFGTEHPKRPSEDELQAVLPLIDYRLVRLDRDRSAVFLPQEGMKLDLGAIAKGFIIDQGLEKIRKLSSGAVLINAGGDIRLSGKKPSGEKWSVGIEDPLTKDRNSGEPCLAVLHLGGELGVATSGDYQRYFKEGGELYHHILDPESGMPAGGLRSVTIVAKDALTADALSTAVFVLGKERGLSLLEQLPGIEGVLVDEEGEVIYSSGLEGKIELMR
ncbi:MAG: FAD:protein FMN transferase [Dethiobacteria bacterium]